MSDFMVSFNLCAEFDHFEDWDAVKKERREYKKEEMRHEEEDMNN